MAVRQTENYQRLFTSLFHSFHTLIRVLLDGDTVAKSVTLKHKFENLRPQYSVSNVLEKVGKEARNAREDEIEITVSMHFDHGLISPYFITDIKTQKVESLSNKLSGQLQVAAVKAPGFSDNRKSISGGLAIGIALLKVSLQLTDDPLPLLHHP